MCCDVKKSSDQETSTVNVWEKEDAKIIREMIWKENEFINYRMTWFIGINAALFAGLTTEKWQWALAIVGIATSVAFFFIFYVSRKAVSKLKSDWDQNSKGYFGPDVIGYFENRWYFMFPWFSLPIVLVILWSAVLFLCISKLF